MVYKLYELTYEDVKLTCGFFVIRGGVLSNPDS